MVTCRDGTDTAGPVLGKQMTSGSPLQRSFPPLLKDRLAHR